MLLHSPELNRFTFFFSDPPKPHSSGEAVTNLINRNKLALMIIHSRPPRTNYPHCMISTANLSNLCSSEMLQLPCLTQTNEFLHIGGWLGFLLRELYENTLMKKKKTVNKFKTTSKTILLCCFYYLIERRQISAKKSWKRKLPVEDTSI